MILPARIREWLHERVTPGGAWFSNRLLEQCKPQAQDSMVLHIASMLAAQTHQVGQSDVTVNIKRLTYAGEDAGDWEVTARRV